MSAPLLSCRDLECHRPLWRKGASHVAGITAEFGSARFHAVCGPAGCGKRLLLHLLGLLERPDGGEVFIDGAATTSLDEPARDALRQRSFGFILPACALLPSLSVLENLALPVLKSGCATESGQAELTLRALQFCGLEGEADLYAGDLDPARASVAAFARAIVHRPAMLIAESPASEAILAPLARRAVDELGLTVVWSGPPEGAAAAAADRVLSVENGRLTATAR
jgi:ABC-type lipoprotein export system ATPase subunit